MKTRNTLISLLKVMAITLTLSVSFSSSAAVQMFLKLGDIEGEVDDNGGDFENAIEVLAFSEGLAIAISPPGGDRTASRPNGSDINITKYLDAASPIIRSNLAAGQVIREATISVRNTGGQNPFVFFEIKLTNVFVTSASTGGSGGEVRLTENISLTYETIRWTYTKTDDRGAAGERVTSGWDFKNSRALP